MNSENVMVPRLMFLLWSQYPSYSYGLAFIAKSQLYGCLTRKTYPAGGTAYLQLVSASPCFQQQLELAACGCSTGQSELCMMASPCTCWAALFGKLRLRIDAKKCEPVCRSAFSSMLLLLVLGFVPCSVMYPAMAMYPAKSTSSSRLCRLGAAVSSV